jgi:hypothetical protein
MNLLRKCSRASAAFRRQLPRLFEWLSGGLRPVITLQPQPVKIPVNDARLLR